MIPELDHGNPIIRTADAGSLVMIGSALVGWLPTIAIVLPIIYYAMLIIEKIYRWYKVLNTKPPEQGPGGVVQ